MDKKTTLADLLKLNLHEFEEEVLEIVDKSVKEMGMEKVSGFRDTYFFFNCSSLCCSIACTCSHSLSYYQCCQALLN